MYPTVVIVLVETQRSMTDICSNASRVAGPVASEAHPATLGHLSVAVGPVHSMTDNEVESQRSRALQSQGRGLEVVLDRNLPIKHLRSESRLEYSNSHTL